MYRQKRITICFPCRNEAKHLADVISRVPKFVDEIIIVSNRSKDDTLAVAKRLGAKVYADNRVIKGIGYGFAHMTAISKATGDIIVGADSDATYPTQELAAVLDYFLDNGFDFVSCNRYPVKKGTKIPFKLRLGVWLLNKEVALLYRLKINDILSGMWVFHKDIKDKLNLTKGDWNFSPQIKLNAALHKDIKFSEFHIGQHERLGVSHQSHFATGISHLKWILANRFSKAVGDSPK